MKKYGLNNYQQFFRIIVKLISFLNSYKIICSLLGKPELLFFTFFKDAAEKEILNTSRYAIFIKKKNGVNE